MNPVDGLLWGCSVMRLTLKPDNNSTKTYVPFADGWLKNPSSPPPPNGDAYATGGWACWQALSAPAEVA